MSRGTAATDEDESLAVKLFSSVGYCASLPESHLNTVTAISGSGPAYVSNGFPNHLPIYISSDFSKFFEKCMFIEQIYYLSSNTSLYKTSLVESPEN